MLERINLWLKHPDYKTGLVLLEDLAAEKFLLDLCRKFNANFIMEKMREFFEEKAKSYTMAVETERPQTNTFKKPEVIKEKQFFDLPQQLKQLNQEKGQLFKECLRTRSIIKKTDVMQKHLAKVITSPTRLTVSEVCTMMEQTDRAGRAQPFSISYLAYDKKTKTGGRIIYYETAQLAMLNKTGSKAYTVPQQQKLKNRNPSHWKHSTRNIFPLASTEYRKVHIWLIFEFNGCEVEMTEAG